MVEYKCNLCNYITNKSSNYKKHLLTKKHINNTEKEKQQKSVSVILPMAPYGSLKSSKKQKHTEISSNLVVNCKYCEKSILQKNLNRHYKNTCLYVPNNILSRLNAKTNNVSINNNCQQNTINITNINNGVINNVNPLGKETFDHISIERMNEILRSNKRLIKEFFSEIYKVKENNNAFINNRTNYLFFVNNDGSVEMDNANYRADFVVESAMERLMEFIIKNKNILDIYAMQIFGETYNIYFNVVNRHNIDDADYIEKESNKICRIFNKDYKMLLKTITNNTKKLEEYFNNKLKNTK